MAFGDMNIFHCAGGLGDVSTAAAAHCFVTNHKNFGTKRNNAIADLTFCYELPKMWDLCSREKF